MSPHQSPFERLRKKFDDSELRCRHCGYRDDSGWNVSTSGDWVEYRFVCSSCDAVETREMRL